jgi:ferredoxin-NADP reductase
MGAQTYRVKVTRIRREAEGVISLRLEPADPAQRLPSATSGAHVDLLLTDALRRSYSLYLPSDGAGYDIAVQREAAGRGGSRHVHDELKQGDALEISAPRNNFELRPGGGVVLIAGGIGVTPIFAMLQSLLAQKRPVTLLYCARTRAHAPFLPLLQGLAEPQVTTQFLFEDEHGRLDLKAWIDRQPADAQYYCCGPGGMLDAFEDACIALGRKAYFVERFSAGEVGETARVDAYVVELARSRRNFTVQAGKSLLDVLLEAGIDINYSCREGACGSCETAVISGKIDHRDCLLSPAERDAGNTMLVCVSGCKAGPLVLDL